jgi:lysophospholipase L1-like esterase
MAQPFAGDIARFKKIDSIHPPAKHAILFVGSSSFTKWTDVQDYFPGTTIINRGFGGSSLPDLIRYATDVIFRYDPKQVVIYCGENDLAASDTVTGEMVTQRFITLFRMIRTVYPNLPIVFVSLKPSPSRDNLKQKMMVANAGIQKFLKKQSNAVFVDVYHHMLGPDGKGWKPLFVEDMLHMNKKGYDIWQKLIEPHLLKQ